MADLRFGKSPLLSIGSKGMVVPFRKQVFPATPIPLSPSEMLSPHANRSSLRSPAGVVRILLQKEDSLVLSLS